MQPRIDKSAATTGGSVGSSGKSGGPNSAMWAS
jgi:hypothetical protein